MSHRISLYPADDQACGNYRLVWPGQALASAGHDVVVNRWRRRHDIELLVENRPAPVPGSPPLVHDVLPIDADMVVFQRPNTRRLLHIIEKIRARGVKVAVDVDDALWEVDRANASWHHYNGNDRYGPHWKWLLRCLRTADVATVSTPALAEKIGGNAIVVPNAIRARDCEAGYDKLADGPWDGDPVIGWAAHLATHPHDPDVTRGRVADAVRTVGTTFLSVGGRVERECAAFGFTEEEFGDIADATGSVHMKRWFKAVSQLDISVVPLADTVFNRAKSALKMLESTAAGAVAVGSPTPDNRRVADDGVGMLAPSPKDWEKILVNLAKDPQARWEIARTSLDRLVEAHTIEGNAWRWMEAWESAWT